jgi:hypothetical protein
VAVMSSKLNAGLPSHLTTHTKTSIFVGTTWASYTQKTSKRSRGGGQANPQADHRLQYYQPALPQLQQQQLPQYAPAQAVYAHQQGPPPQYAQHYQQTQLQPQMQALPIPGQMPLQLQPQPLAPPSQSRSRLQCEYCKSYGHSEDTCYKKNPSLRP